jgi:putative membrane protein
VLQAVAFGVTLGVIAGLTPGIHSNTFAALMLAFSGSLIPYLGYDGIVAAIIASAIAYTIADIIPTTLLGVPDEETAISILPAHRMVLEGKGFEVISLSAFSSFLSIGFTVPLFLSLFAIASFYPLFSSLTPIVLLSVSAFLILSERGDEFEGSMAAWRKKFYALLVFISSGFLGWVSINHSYLATSHFTLSGSEIVQSSILLPLLTGLFGAPLLLQSFSAKIPEQNIQISFPNFDSVIKGSLAGFFVSLFPAVSSGIATALASAGERDDTGFISAMSSANTANAIMCFFMLIVLKKTRSGAADAVKELGFIPSLIDIIVFSTTAALASLTITLIVARVLITKIHRINFSLISPTVLIFLILIVILLTGSFGLAVFFTAIPIGLAASFLGIRRINCMGSLILPILLKSIV